MSRRIESPFPIKGKSRVVSARKQPELTARAIENMRGISPKDGEIKGSKRSGFTQWNTSEVHSGPAAGSEKVQLLDAVITDDRLITYAAIADGSIVAEWQKQLPDTNDVAVAAMDTSGSLYVVHEKRSGVPLAWAKYNSDGVLLYTKSLPNASGLVRAFTVDRNNDVYIGMSEGGSVADARLYRFRAEPDDTYSLAWEKVVEVSSTTSYVTNIKIKSDTLYILAHDAGGAACEVQVFEQYRTTTAPIPTITFSTEIVARGLAINDAGEIFTSAQSLSPLTPAHNQWLTKYDSQGTEIWQIESLAAATHTPGTTPANYHPGGIGFACEVNSEGDIYTSGARGSGATQDASFCKIVDDGDEPNMDPTGSTYWEQTWATSSDVLNQVWRNIAVDEFDNVYHHDDFSNASTGQVQIEGYEKDGASGVATQMLSYLHTASGQYTSRGRALLLPPVPETPEYQDSGPTRPEFIYLLQTEPISGTSSSFAVEKLRLVSVTSTTGSNRNITVVTAVDGDIFRLTAGAGGGVSPVGPNTIAKPELETDPQIIQTAAAFNKLFIVDGVNSLYYDPVTDEVLKWESQTAGRVPPRCKLLTFWRGRATLARDPDNANAWHMAQAWKPFNWNVLPRVITQTQAMTSSLTDGPGEVPDIINALVPYDRDLLIFLCDHHLFVMRGDPAAGGQIELASDVTGGSLGSPWVRDPEGVLYFFGSEGGVYRWVPGSMPVRISSTSIDRELFDLDLTSVHIAMEWSVREDGIRIVQLPFDDGGAELKGYFWERKTGGWFPDSFADTDHNPTAITSIDGDDPTDRLILYGCEDGFVRYVDETSFSDDDEAIDANVLYGPYFDDEDYVTALDMFRVELDREGDGCRWEWYVTESVDDPLVDPQQSGSCGPGNNAFERPEVRGNYLWLKLINASDGQYFAIINVEVFVVRSGLIEVA